MTSNAAADRRALTLYVNGASTSSIHALEIVRRVRDEKLGGHVDLEVIDVRQRPSLVARDQIVAVPTLVKRLPVPVRRIAGDLSGSAWIRLGLDPDSVKVSDGPPGPGK